MVRLTSALDKNSIEVLKSSSLKNWIRSILEIDRSCFNGFALLQSFKRSWRIAKGFTGATLRRRRSRYTHMEEDELHSARFKLAVVTLDRNNERCLNQLENLRENFIYFGTLFGRNEACLRRARTSAMTGNYFTARAHISFTIWTVVAPGWNCGWERRTVQAQILATMKIGFRPFKILSDIGKILKTIRFPQL